MGIKGLWPAIKSTIKCKVVRMPEVSVVLVDCGLLIHKLYHALSTMHTNKKYTKTDIVNVMTRNLTVKLVLIHRIAKNAKLIFVYDGKMPKEKIRGVPQEKIPKYIWELSEEVFRAYSPDTHIIHAETEADITIGKLNARAIMAGHTCLVFSDDSDMFYYGARYVMQTDGQIYELGPLLDKYKLSARDFLRICNVAGNDYNGTSRTWSPKLLSKYEKDVLPRSPMK